MGIKSGESRMPARSLGVVRESGSWGLLGRGRECDAIDHALDVVEGGAAVRVWVEGEPGSGKTALAEWVRSRRDRVRCVSAVGVESESGLSLAAALTVVRGLRGYVDEVAPAYRDPLRGLLGLSSKGNDDPLLLGAALLDLIATAAVERPLLLTLDDWHWVDPVSAAALEFAFRRLEKDAVGVFISSRQPPTRQLTRSTDLVISLAGLGIDAGAELLARDGPIAAGVARAIVAATAGLPLALREVSGRLSAAQRMGGAPLPSPLPIGARLLAEYGARLSRLPSDVRLAAGVAAVAGSDPTGILPALTFLNLDTDLLDTAEAAGVISGGSSGPVFPHPLMRAAALAQLSGLERRRIEWAFASTVEDPERRAVHLVASTQGPSPQISTLLADAAEEVASRRGPLAAAGIWADAAQVTPAGPRRIAGLLKAGELLTAVGRLSEAQHCLAELRDGGVDPQTRAAGAILMSWSRWWSEPADAAEDALAEAERVVAVSPSYASRLRCVAAVCYIVCADLGSALKAIPPRDSPIRDSPIRAGTLPTLEVLAHANVLACVGWVAEASRELSAELVRQWIRLARRGPADVAVIAGLQLAAIMLACVERFDEARELADAAIGSARRSGRPQGIAFWVGVDSTVGWWRGDWDRMNAALEEMLTLAGDTGENTLVDTANALLGRLAAARGDAEQARRYLDDWPGSVDGRRSLATLYRLSALGLWHLGGGRPAEAASVLGELDQAIARSGIGNPACMPYVDDYIAALLESGSQERARSVIERTLREAEQTGLAWPRAVGLRGRGMLGCGPDIDRDFAEALRAWPGGFYGARTRLAWAESLLARDKAGDSRELLESAAQEFSRLGARPWLARTSKLLGMQSGATPEADRDPGLFSVLTAQELRVALKVAEGRTNREAAAQLFISAKTVEHHLSATYNKLGIRSRTELVRLIAKTDAHDPTR